jgi:thioredoxin-related protein
MNRFLFLIGLIFVFSFSCEQKPNTYNAELGTVKSEINEGEFATNLKDSLSFNFSDTLSKYNKPILFYMRTDWCRGCKSLEKHTVDNVEFRSLVNKNFKFYKIDGDLPYQFQLKDSVYIKQGLMNDFMYAFYESSEMASYPSFMIISEKEEVATVVPPTI